MELWIVGQWKEPVWELAGVFESEELAIAACRDHTYFVGPAELNVLLPHDTEEWPGCRYPKRPDPRMNGAIVANG